MTILGKIKDCLGGECPTPCCGKSVYIWPQEFHLVVKPNSNLFTTNISEAKKSNRLIYFNTEQSYIEHCFVHGCKFENSTTNSQKGILCITFPIYISLGKKGSMSKTLRLNIVDSSICPLVTKPQVISDHFHNTVKPALQQRLPHLESICFEHDLARLMGIQAVSLPTV